MLTAKLAREAFETDWVKLEVIGDDRTLLPDAVELLAAAEQLVDDGFIVLPYTNDDPVLARRLQQVGLRRGHAARARPSAAGWVCATPTTSPCSSRQADVPVILDAGIGTASDAALAMELGCDGVLVATAVNRAHHPAADGRGGPGRGHRRSPGPSAGRIPRRLHAEASSPIRSA